MFWVMPPVPFVGSFPYIGWGVCSWDSEMLAQRQDLIKSSLNGKQCWCYVLPWIEGTTDSELQDFRESGNITLIPGSLSFHLRGGQRGWRSKMEKESLPSVPRPGSQNHKKCFSWGENPNQLLSLSSPNFTWREGNDQHGAKQYEVKGWGGMGYSSFFLRLVLKWFEVWESHSP